MAHTSTSPTVTIGLAVRNGAATLESALSGLLNQTHRDVRLLISDNASQDETQAICEKWAARDARIEYLRQPQNIGPVPNFHFLLNQAASPYFMWAAHDDEWAPDFIAANLAVLESDPQVICSVSDVELFDAPKMATPLIAGVAPLMADCRTNLIEYLQEPGANSRIYGLYRTTALQRSFLASDVYWAFDWAIVARTLTYGRHAQVPRPLMRRRCRGQSSDASRNIRYYNASWWGRRFPMLPFTCALLADDRIPKTPAILRLLASWNHCYLKQSLRDFRRRRLYPVLERLHLRSTSRLPDVASRLVH